MNNIHYTQKIMRRITSGAFLIILLVSACNAAINGSILPIQTSKALATVPDNNDNVETVYLKFVSQALKESNANTSSASGIVITEALLSVQPKSLKQQKDLQYLQKDIWFNKSEIICIGLQMAHIIPCF